MSSVCMCFSTKGTEEPYKTVKLTLDHRPESLLARYAAFDTSNEPNRPHISSDTRDVKERGDKKPTKALIP